MSNIHISDEGRKKLEVWVRRHIALEKALKGLSDKKEAHNE